MIVLILSVAAITIAFYLVKLKFQHWKKLGVKGPTPVFPVGNLGKSALFLKPLGVTFADIYNKYPNEEFVGIYRGLSPVLLLRDPDLIKEITVKAFSHFHDNDIYVDKDRDPFLARNPFFMKGEEWKIVRAQLTPNFTSGKMKILFPLLEETSRNLVKFINSTPDMTNGRGYEAKELSIRLTLNNVGSCAFGLDAKCFEEDNPEFRQMAKQAFEPKGWTLFAFLLIILFPEIGKYLPIKTVPAKLEKQLYNVITETLKYREKNGIVRNDFLHIISQLKQTCKDYEFTDMDVVAHAVEFFSDGTETSAMVMSFTLYEIASNTEVQNKLREEIESAFNGKDSISYEDIQKLEYLDAVIDESLRIHSPVQFLQKVCTQDFTYTPKNTNKPLLLKKDTSIIIPSHGLHYDSKYYDNPKSFNPERFLSHNKENLTKFTFLPFGEGPRACLGRRFALLQIKTGIAYIIKNFQITVNKRTIEPIEYMSTLFTTPKGGLWLDFKKL